MTRWILIAGDFSLHGGMDRANHALASDLASRGDAEVHLIAHRAADDLVRRPSIRVHHVARPLGSHIAGAPLLAWSGERWARRLKGNRTHVIANGGNADAGDVTWIHHLNAAHVPVVRGSLKRRVKNHVARHYFEAREGRAIRGARLVLCNSRRTASDVVSFTGIPESRVRTVYYGCDPVRFPLVTAKERETARRALGWATERCTALFIGALGDERKGFDRLFAAWSRLCSAPSWDVDLAVIGIGEAAPEWRRRAADESLSGRMRFLGFRDDVARVLAAADVLIHPARYEAYGLAVHEAICRGVPAMVNGAAGIAELYPADLADLLIRDVERVDELVDRIQTWRARSTEYAARVKPFADRLRARSWCDMAEEIVQAVEA